MSQQHRLGKGSESRGEAIRDPKALLSAIQALLEAETEFPIKVEGTSTLPYACQVVSIQPQGGTFLLKLVRPLPHELAVGAPFLMVFTVQDQRFEAHIHFQGREAYLRYRFDLPASMAPSDRRREPRSAFRPRESAYVIAQDSGLPGRVLAGPLLNISLGGLAIRVDRVLTLDDGMRIPPRTALFDRGLGLSRIRVQDLPRLPLLEVRGTVAHTLERGSEVVVGVCFDPLTEDQARDLNDSLRFRERILHATALRPRAGGEGGAEDGAPPGAPGEVPAEGDRGSFRHAPLAVEDPLIRLQRRVPRVLLVMAPGPRRDQVVQRLRPMGYGRLGVVPDLAAAAARQRGEPAPDLVLVDLHQVDAGEGEPLAAMRQLEAQARSLGSARLAVLCEVLDPTLLMAQGPGLHLLGEDEPAAWAGILDGILRLSAS